MATVLMPYDSPNAGVWVVSAGTFLDAVASQDGEYVSSTTSTGQFFVSLDDVSAVEPINKVTVRVRARLAEAGSRDMTVALHNGVINYHPTVTNITATGWQMYEWVWEQDPWLSVPWTLSTVNAMTRAYVRCAITGGTTDTQVDYVEIEVDYGTAGLIQRTVSDSFAVTDSVTSQVQSPTLVQRTVQDSFTVNDSLVRLVSHKRSVEDTFTVLDDGDPQITVVRDGVEDTLGFTDLVTWRKPGEWPLQGVTGLWVGDTQITQVWLGDTQIWGS